jgi:hypothetical protein
VEAVGTELLKQALVVDENGTKEPLAKEVNAFAHELLSVGRLGRNDLQMWSELRDRFEHDVVRPSLTPSIERAPSPLGGAVTRSMAAMNPHPH